MRNRDLILDQFPERDLEGVWEVSPDADSRWRAAVLEVLLDIREHLGVLAEAKKREEDRA